MSGRSSAAVESITRGSSTLSIGGIAGTGARRENRVLELQILVFPADELHLQMMRIDDLGVSLQVLNLAVLDQLSGAARQPVHDAVLEIAQLGQIDRRLAEGNAPLAGVLRLVEEVRHVQERLRRNAAAVDADAAGVDLGIDERRGQTEIRCQKRRRVSAGTGADDTT